MGGKTNDITMHIHYFQHASFEGPGCIAEWAGVKGHTISVTEFFKDAIFPDLQQIDMLIVMGGPMGVYEESKYSWLVAEKAYIRSAIEAGKPVLGICLGSQLIAAVLGARVYPNTQKEIGWFPVHFNDLAPDGATVFHWHGDTFDLPEGATLLASTAVTPNQAYLYGGKVIGLQFHFEVTPATMNRMLEHCGDELVPAQFVQSEKEIRAGVHHCAANNAWMFELLDSMEKL